MPFIRMNYSQGNPPPMIPNTFSLPVPPPMYAAPSSFGIHGNAKPRPNRKRRNEKNPGNDRMASLEDQGTVLFQLSTVTSYLNNLCFQ